MTFRISNIYKSLVRQITDDVERAKAGVSPDLQYHSWDTRAEEAELPPTDLVGLAGWTFDEDRGLWTVHCGITISTINDQHMLREIDLIDLFHDSWGEQRTIPLYDDAGTEAGQLMVDHFEILVAGYSEKRNYRPLGMTLRRTANER